MEKDGEECNGSMVFYCGPSNKSVDVVARMYNQSYRLATRFRIRRHHSNLFDLQSLKQIEAEDDTHVVIKKYYASNLNCRIEKRYRYHVSGEFSHIHQ